MGVESYITAGKIVGVFGVKGWLKVKAFTEAPDGLFDYSPWLLQPSDGGPLKEWRVSEGKITDKGMLVAFEGLSDRELAKSLVGSLVLVDKQQLPELGEGEFYWHQLEGMTVVTVQGVNLGKVSHLMETGANDVVVIVGDEAAVDRRERLLPYIPDDVIVAVDLESRVITVDWDPEF
ncbi:MAG: ribosome maturation factor RimM [Hahellaceae bacterium]|jgi:16S rRNA processing protein RimM|nr:ribosome maturation factor RimM [Hahellaceae bacterium]